MMLSNYSQIRLSTEKYKSEGIEIGAIGYIIETYGEDAYEVEFSDENGITIGLIVAHGSELEVCEPDLPADGTKTSPTA